MLDPLLLGVLELLDSAALELAATPLLLLLLLLGPLILLGSLLLSPLLRLLEAAWRLLLLREPDNDREGRPLL
jgi:hypothetical protein